MLVRQGIGGPFTLVDIPINEDANGSVSWRNRRLLDTAHPQGLRIANRGRIHVNFRWALTDTAYRVAPHHHPRGFA
jgi:hypothetical protein